MELVASRFDDVSLARYAELFARCFPQAGHLKPDYLRWLYRENPAGTVVGFDAWEGDRLAAHYVCVPASVRVGSSAKRGLLSLNTATHPDFQGKGLFTKLAERTYAEGQQLGFDLVYGVANANSTPGFLRKLGFTLVTPLDSWIGFGSLRGIDWQQVAASEFARSWPEQELAWRLMNPVRPVRSVALADGSTGFFAPSGKPAVRAWAQLPGQLCGHAHGGAGFGPRVYLGKLPGRTRAPGAYAAIPAAFRPSPLNLIVRGLQSDVQLDPGRLAFSFLDFDAF